MQLSVLSTTASSKKITVSDELFGTEINPVLIAQALRVYRARLRQGTSKTKTRAEVARTKKKWFKQKGTGNARHGARTPNIFVGGGVSHGPNGMQNWDLDLSQQMKHQALIGALTLQAANTVVLDATAAATEGKVLRKLLEKHAGDKKTLVILPETQQELIRKIQNMELVLVTTADQVTVFEAALADVIIVLNDTMPRLEARLLNKVKKASVKAETKAKPAAKKAAAKKPTTTKKVTK